MRRTFLKWLFIFVAAAFLLTFSVSFVVQTEQSRENAVNLIKLKIDDARHQIMDNRHDVEVIRDIADATSLAKARAFARMIALKPSLLKDRRELERIRKELDVDELHVSDEKGILIASIPAEYEGYDMSSSDQSRAFMPALTDPDFALAQAPQAKGINYELFQYSGVARLGKSGIVQVGYHPKRLQRAMEIADIEKLSSGFRIGTNGRIIVARNGMIVSIHDQAFLGKSLQEYGISPSSVKSETEFRVKNQGVRYIALSRNFEGYDIIGLLPYEEMYIGRNAMGVILIVCNLILFAMVFMLVSFLVQKVVINGIYSVNRSLERITKGDLTERIEVKTNPEFISLSEGINSTVSALKHAIADAAARIDAELEFARAIQLSTLPSVFPPYPDRREFEIYATMHTAKEVGGDFYDFFLIGEHQLVVVIADVSGKGIPSALFMMTAKTMIQNLTESGLEPARVFAQANKHLCENNEMSMFVTAFMGTLELDTGKFTFVNAGHNPPMIKKAGGPYRRMKIRSGFVLGGMEGIDYEQEEIMLEAGDTLYLYTDGVTEALNQEKVLFSEARLEAVMNSDAARSMDVTRLLSHIKEELDRFTAGAEQADDITMLGLEYKGRGDK